MGMDLLTHGWTVEKNTAGASSHELAEPLHHILNALPDVWFTDERMQTLDENEYYAPLEGDESGAQLSNLRNALTVGAEDYALHLTGMHRHGTSYPILGTDMWFHIAGGGSWGDDPYFGWNELGMFLAACYLLRELADAAGYVCAGLPQWKEN